MVLDDIDATVVRNPRMIQVILLPKCEAANDVEG